MTSNPRVLTINNGSSSIKFALFEVGDSLRGVHPHRRLIASLDYLLTSHVWQQDHNGFTHQDGPKSGTGHGDDEHSAAHETNDPQAGG